MQNGEHLWPDGFYELIFTYGKVYLLEGLNGANTPLPQNFLIGLFDHALKLNSPGITGLFGIRFHAWGLYPLLGRPMSELNNRIVSLKEIFEEEIEFPKLEPTEKEKAVAELQKFILKIFESRDQDIDVTRNVGQSISTARGNIKIADVVSQYGLSPRKIQRLFVEQTGISAKHYAKIVRFREAKRSIEKNPGINMAELTYSSGYSDQPHFIRNFKQLYGMTPSQHRKRILEFISTRSKSAEKG